MQSIFHAAKRSQENPNRHYSQDVAIPKDFSAVNEIHRIETTEQFGSVGTASISDVTDFRSRLGYSVSGLMFLWLPRSAQTNGGILP